MSDNIKLVIGYYDWRDTVCKKCQEKYALDVSRFSELMYSNALADDGYICGYCGREFPKKDSVRKAGQV